MQSLSHCEARKLGVMMENCTSPELLTKARRDSRENNQPGWRATLAALPEPLRQKTPELNDQRQARDFPFYGVKPEMIIRSPGYFPGAGWSLYSLQMNTTFLSWQAFQPNELRTIEIDNNELTLIYNNDSALDLEFADEEQLDRFVSHLVLSLVDRESPEEVRWN
jgi:hypothetical protein